MARRTGPSPSLGKEGRLLLSVPKSVPNGGPYGDRGGSRPPPLGWRLGGRALRSRGVLLGSLHALLIGSLGMYLLRAALCKALP